MVGPMMPDLALAPIRAMDEASMTHEAVRGAYVTVDGPAATRVKTWVYTATPVKARLNPLGQDAPERAGAAASAQFYSLSVPAGTPGAAGDRWRVSGETSGEPWIRDVYVQREVFPKSIEVRRRFIVTDLAANP